MPIAVLVLIFIFDWRLGICCLVPLAVSVFFMKQMMGGDNAGFNVSLNRTFIRLIPADKTVALVGASGSGKSTAARPDATREEVLHAVRCAQCQEIIDRLPDGLDSVVGNGGTYLSGGENQRIALARAVLKDAPIVILSVHQHLLDLEIAENS